MKAYADLTRAHLAICWPLLFCACLLLAFARYGGFSWPLLIKAAIIGLCAVVAGFVLNDYIDRDLDSRDTDPRLSRYWRPFEGRPIPAGRIRPGQALGLFLLLAAIAAGLSATLPRPHSFYLLALMAIAYSLEVFYQIKKRDQCLPLAQLVGRIDFALFPVAGYLAHGRPDVSVALLFAFFYPWTIAHLGVNDLVDMENDRARGMASVAILYGARGTAVWILVAAAAHVLAAPLFAAQLGTVARAGIALGLLPFVLAVAKIVRSQDARSGLTALPLFHLGMAVYVSGIIATYVIS